ncbi:MAG: ribosome small subunit-dependent GTPase A [Bacteroidaceae bacterium]|nr:ribosome small subunit-dependent GTPase A [Bacteroidaceae bacterium]
MTGIVIKNTGSWYVVRTDDGQLFSCKVKGNFRLRGIRSTNPVAVGDHVTIIPSPDGTALIADILDRRNYIIRRASNLSKQSHILAANVDQVLLLVTVAHPETSTTFVDRFLASAEAYRIPVILVFNKMDMYDETQRAVVGQLTALYRSIGYTCIACSALRGEGMTELAELLCDKTTLLSGNSGVGKSTLLNTLVPGLEVDTAEISQAHDTGQHTTTFSEMYPLPTGGQLIDTPGIKGFGTFDIEREELGHYFRELFRQSDDCRFANCTHTHEPGCAVRQAVERGEIALSRYASYLNMLDDKSEDKYRKGD